MLVAVVILTVMITRIMIALIVERAAGGARGLVDGGRGRARREPLAGWCWTIAGPGGPAGDRGGVRARDARALGEAIVLAMVSGSIGSRRTRSTG